MAKVTINGEVFGFDPNRKPMFEALEIERGLNCTYSQWEQDMGTGSARALCGFIWIVWHRDGRDVKLEDILNGSVEVDIGSLSLEPEPGEEVPPTSPDPAISSTTGSGTSEPSASSGSGPGKPGSSSRTSSRRSSTTSSRKASSNGHRADQARIAELEHEMGIGDPEAEAESLERLKAEAEANAGSQ